MTSFYAWTLILSSSLLLGCAEDPSSPVAPFDWVDRDSKTEQITLSALKFSGRGSLGLSCDLYIAEEDGHIFVKVAYRASDGHTPLATQAEFFLYDASDGKYYSTDSNQPDTKLSLSGVTLVHKSEEVDRNRLNEYISQNELLQSIRIEFSKAASSSEFVSALSFVLENPAQLPNHSATLNQIEAVEMILLHGDHYHTPTCRNYSLNGIEETEFDISDEHQHDHE